MRWKNVFEIYSLAVTSRATRNMHKIMLIGRIYRVVTRISSPDTNCGTITVSIQRTPTHTNEGGAISHCIIICLSQEIYYYV